MRRIILCLLLMTGLSYAQQIKIGEKVPDFTLDTVLNASSKSFKSADFKDKIIWIEFWATWCGPCISAMPHLEQMQAKYKDKLQVITVTNEKEERIRQFLKNKPFKLWFAIDGAEQLRKYFPFAVIPHSILIDTEGNLFATAAPEEITEKIIDSLWAKQKPKINVKTDNLTTDYIQTYFKVPDTVKERVLWQPEIKGGPGMLHTFALDSNFKGRRLTFINVGLNNMYMRAFGDFPYGRTIDKVKDKNRYCLDIIVEKPQELIPALKAELASKFNLHANITPYDKEVLLLKIEDQNLFNKVTRNSSGKRTYFARHGEIDQQGITMNDFADFLEIFGYGKFVLDETGNQEKFDIKFSFAPEDPQSLTKILSNMGLRLEKAHRKIDMLTIE
ncbi:redoxin family protein [Pedobacter montanisoli]|uniref:Redoxin family protein n=1 Tax=Pedobacter montanisoli TaxID=2923277 RepID=A0ABS9ZY57_9SPHI|nr:redoxin family protein [Pedobacter montanisoli]MCJ0743256.1 redoxin family protein [Pedobacter montanisoli]